MATRTGKNIILLLCLCSFILPAIVRAQLPHVAGGTINRFPAFSSAFVDARNVDVWLPPGYDKTQSYPVLYMHDGQMLFDSTVTWNKQEWGVDETVSSLVSSKKINSCIVVGIWNNGKYRHSEYFPQTALHYLQQDQQKILMPYLLDTPRADAYLKFLVRELKPFIDSSFSTKKDPASTFIAGSSMGGLISLYALCEYPQVFGAAACLSTHWPGTFETKNNPVPGAIIAYLHSKLPAPGRHRIYFDYGTATLDSLYAPYQQMVDALMRIKGYNANDWITRSFRGEDHSENAWRKRLHLPLLFLLGTTAR